MLAVRRRGDREHPRARHEDAERGVVPPSRGSRGRKLHRGGETVDAIDGRLTQFETAIHPNARHYAWGRLHKAAMRVLPTVSVKAMEFLRDPAAVGRRPRARGLSRGHHPRQARRGEAAPREAEGRDGEARPARARRGDQAARGHMDPGRGRHRGQVHLPDDPGHLREQRRRRDDGHQQALQARALQERPRGSRATGRPTTSRRSRQARSGRASRTPSCCSPTAPPTRRSSTRTPTTGTP